MAIVIRVYAAHAKPAKYAHEAALRPPFETDFLYGGSRRERLRAQ